MKAGRTSVVEQLRGFPRAILLIEKRGSPESDLVGAALDENEGRMPGTYVSVIHQDHPEIAEDLGITSFPSVVIFENGKEKARLDYNQLTE